MLEFLFISWAFGDSYSWIPTMSQALHFIAKAFIPVVIAVVATAISVPLYIRHKSILKQRA